MEKFEAPIPGALVEELVEFWKGIPELPQTEQWPNEMRGITPTPNRSVIYVERRSGQVVGMCQFWISRRLPVLAEFCNPATHPAFRGQGIGTALWQAAVDDAFKVEGVRAIFLGTYLPDAFRLYRRLGFAKMPSSTTFVKVANGDMPEEFLTDWFRERGTAQVSPGEPDDQIPSYPLLVCPHHWQVLDANVGVFSVRYSLHRTFHGLHLKYRRLAEEGHGAWFAARGDDRRVVGLASARLDTPGVCAVDAFAHHRYLSVWPDLLEAAMTWGKGREAYRFQARVSRGDAEKRTLFEQCGFKVTGPAPDFVLDGLQMNRQRDIESVAVPALRLEQG